MIKDNAIKGDGIVDEVFPVCIGFFLSWLIFYLVKFV
jgi:hypothetical protein